MVDLSRITIHESRLTNHAPRPLMFFALPGRRWLHQLQLFRQVPAHLVLNDLFQSDVCHSQAGMIRNQRTAGAARAGVELADAPRDQIDQYVGIGNFC